MTVARPAIYQVRCDVLLCGNAGPSSNSYVEARRSAYDLGWRRAGPTGADVCPDHIDRYRAVW